MWGSSEVSHHFSYFISSYKHVLKQHPVAENELQLAAFRSAMIGWSQSMAQNSSVDQVWHIKEVCLPETAEASEQISS